MFGKRGKREMHGMTPSQTSKKMKRTLLYTYFTTLASLVLCCAMFLGTTMAWFTSDVSNTGNVIQVGSLAANVYRVEDNGDFDLSDHANPAFVISKVWQPMNAEAEAFKVVNGGSLDFNYTMDLAVKAGSAKDGNGTALTEDQLDAFLKCFDVYVIPGRSYSPGLKSFVEEKTDPAWTKVGTLHDVIKGIPASGGTVQEVLIRQGTVDVRQAGENESADAFTVGIYMKKEVDATFMGWNMELIVHLVANQLTSSN